MTEKRTHFRACNLCEAICGLEIEVENKKVISIKGDVKDPLSKGHICPKAFALKDIYEDKDRLKQPIKRTSNGWEKISWEEAYDYAVAGLKKVQKTYGNNAIGIYSGNPNAHNYGAILAGPAFIKSLGTINRFSATSADQLPHHFAAHQMLGHYFQIPIPDIDRTDYLLILGGNPLVSNGSLMTAPGFGKRMRAIQSRGQVVVVDPRKSETAIKADKHHFIKPGTDALFLAALINTVFSDEMVDLGHLENHIKGIDKLPALFRAYTPDIVSRITGISANDIKKIAHEFAKAKRAVCYGRMGVSTQEFGGICLWMINLLNILTGNFDTAGGAMFTHPAFDTVTEKRKGKTHRFKSRVRGLPEMFGELPAATMIEEMTTKGEGQIKAFVTSAGNPVLSTPNGTALEKAFSELDFMVSIDIYLNETTKHANVILPPTTGLETTNYDVVFHKLAVQNTAKFSQACFEKNENQRHDYEIFAELTKRMNPEHFKPQPTPENIVDYGLQMGAYGKTGLNLQTLKDNPHGFDLGALRSCLPEGLFTEDKKIDLAPSLFIEDLSRLAKRLKSQNKRDLLLIGRRELRSNNSWMHNSPTLMTGRNRCTLLVHPEDAAWHNFNENEEITVESNVGSIAIPIEISEEVMRGVVSIPHGYGHNRKGTQLELASQHAGSSINDLTDDKFIDALTGNAAFSGVVVRLKKLS